MKRQQFCITKITMWQHTLQVNDLKIQLYKHNIYIVAICFYLGHSRHEYWFIQNIDHSPWRHGDDRSKRNPTLHLYRINIDIRISRCAMINPNQSLWSEEEWSGYYVSWSLLGIFCLLSSIYRITCLSISSSYQHPFKYFFLVLHILSSMCWKQHQIQTPHMVYKL